MAEDLIYKNYKEDVFGINSKVEVFFTCLLDKETLAAKWRDIRNFVAKNQMDLDDEFERWNFYLFYMVNNPIVDLNLKYEIEHDTISSRKMVVDNMVINDDVCNELVKKYIKYSIDNQEQKFAKVFIKDESVKMIVKRIKEGLE